MAITLDDNVFSAIFNYLDIRPHREVRQLVDAMLLAQRANELAQAEVPKTATATEKKARGTKQKSKNKPKEDANA